MRRELGFQKRSGIEHSSINRSLRQESSRVHQSVLGSQSVMTHEEVSYAKEVTAYNAAVAGSGGSSVSR